MFTPEAKIEQQVIKLHFPFLWNYYDAFLGNFIFHPIEFRQQIKSITKWMETFEGYRIIFEDDMFVLTNF